MRFFIAVALMAVVASTSAKRHGGHQKSEACKALKECKQETMIDLFEIDPTQDDLMAAMECSKPCMEEHKIQRQACKPDREAIKQCMADKGFAKSSEEDGDDDESENEDEEDAGRRGGPGGRRGGPGGPGGPGGRRGPKGERPEGKGRRGSGERGGHGIEKALHMLPYADEMMDALCPVAKPTVSACLSALGSKFSPATYNEAKRDELFAGMCAAECETEDACRADMQEMKAEREAKRAERPESSDRVDRAARKAAKCECRNANTIEGCDAPQKDCAVQEEDEKMDKFEKKEQMCASGKAPSFEEFMKMMKQKGGKRGGKRGGRGGRHH
jgi:hypothetical protein